MPKLEQKYNLLTQAFINAKDKQEKKRIKYHLIYLGLKLNKPITQMLYAK